MRTAAAGQQVSDRPAGLDPSSWLSRIRTENIPPRT